MKIEPWDEVSELAGREHVIDRLIAPDWVNVVAVTEQNELLLVRQWRFGCAASRWKFRRAWNEPGEEPLAAGQPELLEETGYAGRRCARHRRRAAESGVHER
jgi:hypothetical protein